MALYAYKAIDAQGKRIIGVIEGMNEVAARQQLRAQGVMVTELTSKLSLSRRENLIGKHRIAFSLQLSQLLQSGVPLYESLVAIEEYSRQEPYYRVLHSLAEQVKSGIALSQAMKSHPGSFDTLVCSLVAAGEAVGDLGGSMEKIAKLLTKQQKLQNRIVSAMTYPALLSSFALLIVFLLLGFVIPSIEGIFEDRPVQGMTRFVLGLSHAFRSHGLLFFSLLSAGIGWGVWRLRSREGKIWLQKFLLHVPLLRKLTIEAAIVRFCRTLATLQQGGLPLIDSLRISREVMQNVSLEEEMERAEQKIIEGNSLSSELYRSRFFPKLVSRMVAVGEESGNSTFVLFRVADMIEEEMEKTMETILSFLQPIILLLMGIVIGIVLIAILLPLTDVGSFSM